MGGRGRWRDGGRGQEGRATTGVAVGPNSGEDRVQGITIAIGGEIAVGPGKGSGRGQQCATIAAARGGPNRAEPCSSGRDRGCYRDGSHQREMRWRSGGTESRVGARRHESGGGGNIKESSLEGRKVEASLHLQPRLTAVAEGATQMKGGWRGRVGRLRNARRHSLTAEPGRGGDVWHSPRLIVLFGLNIVILEITL